MSKWQKTPFDSLEAAYAMADKMKLRPSAIAVKDNFRSFTIKEGRKIMLLAQKGGEGPVMEKVIKELPPQEGPFFSDADRLQVGPWILSDHETLADVGAHWREQFANFDNVEILDVVMYRIGDDEYEYAADDQGIWQRVLHRKK